MVNEHFAELAKGPEDWNRWRDLNPDIWPNLSGADLSRMDLREVNLQRTSLASANLEEAIFAEKEWYGADLRNADLNRADLRGAIFKHADFERAILVWAQFTGADFTASNMKSADLSLAEGRGAILVNAILRKAELSAANFQAANLVGADLRSARLHKANLEGAILTNALLWETQRVGWSIKGVTCERAYWDKDGCDATEYEPGEFERLYSAQPVIELFYKGGVTKFELNTLPALLSHLATQHPGCHIRLKSIEEIGSGAKVTISVADSDGGTFEEIKAEAERSQSAQIALRDESRRAERLEIEKRLLLDEVFPRMLAAAGPQVHIAGPAARVAIASGNASIDARQTVNDLSSIRPLLEAVMNQRGNLGLGHDQTAQLEKAIRDVQQELQSSHPKYPVLSGGLRIVRDFVVGALGNAAGTALATNTWQPLLDQLGYLINQFR